MPNGELDDTDRILLRALTQDSRMAAAALAPLVELTRQAVTKQVERLRQPGILQHNCLFFLTSRVQSATQKF